MSEETTALEVTEEVQTEQPAPADQAAEPVKIGMKETNELLDMLESATGLTAKVLADGKVDFGDLQHLVEEGKKLHVYVDGIDDVDEVLKELKDLDEAEVLALVVRLYKLAKMVKEAIDKSKVA